MNDLQELSDEPDPHATLPFISHHTLNLTRDLNDSNVTNNNNNSKCLKLGQNPTFYPKIPWNLMLKKCEFCEFCEK